MPSKLALSAVVVAGLIAPISASAEHAPHSCPHASPQRSGGISEMAACGKSGVKGNRVQFVRAINRPVENRYFLSRLAH
jgi:hypothetical protein